MMILNHMAHLGAAQYAQTIGADRRQCDAAVLTIRLSLISILIRTMCILRD